MPTVENKLEGLTEELVFSKLDETQVFPRLSLTQVVSSYLPSLSQFGRYIFKCLAFGISSVPKYSQKRMDKSYLE